MFSNGQLLSLSITLMRIYYSRVDSLASISIRKKRATSTIKYQEMSGSFKKASKANQKVHRERSQPASRAHLGPLEKKKDYRERAREFQKKRDTIKVLKKKAQNRNPDEFYFNMVSTQKVDGLHEKRKDKEETTTEAQQLLLQREDLRYVQWKRTVELKKIEKLKSSLQLLDPEFKQNKHTIFVDTEKEVSLVAQQAAAKLQKERHKSATSSLEVQDVSTDNVSREH